mmetsp:Transcript_28330/g.91682  ORF Transcript_28330/g.91682 Transcript_28330/m.91682 type:complete len:103 (+) Transcript_28330:279-587(+)
MSCRKQRRQGQVLPPAADMTQVQVKQGRKRRVWMGNDRARAREANERAQIILVATRISLSLVPQVCCTRRYALLTSKEKYRLLLCSSFEVYATRRTTIFTNK